MSAAVRQIGRYAIEGVIGTGGFATVYRARDDRLGDAVAIKVLAENHAHDPRMRERFIAEGSLLRRARSEHLLGVHDMGETDHGQPFLVLEHADRGDLGQRVRQMRAGGHQPDGRDARAVARAAGSGVAALHRICVVHRDLTPANLLLLSNGGTQGTATPGAVVGADERLVIADLGLCKDLARHSGLTVGTGTSGFCPPEQRHGPSTVDARADLWALSAILVWLYTGEPPDAHQRWVAEIVRLGATVELAGVLEAGLAADPDDRPPSVAAWETAVNAALGEPPAQVRAESGKRSTFLPRRAPTVVAAAVGLALGVGGAGLAQVVAGPGPETTRQRLDDGRTRAVARRGATTVAVIGPARVKVGEAARFEAQVEGATTWVWLAPDGVVHPGAAELVLRTSGPGVAPVSLVAVAGDGTTVEAVLPLEVRRQGG